MARRAQSFVVLIARECWCCGALADLSGDATCACTMFPADAGGPTCSYCEDGGERDED